MHEGLLESYLYKGPEATLDVGEVAALRKDSNRMWQPY